MVVETIFGIPGIGRYFVQGALGRDYTLVMGTVVVIANGRTDGILQKIVAGENVGTLIPASGVAESNGGLNHRRRWVAFFHHAHGQIVVDDGARDALLKRGKSLLPVGVRDVSGQFAAGDLVEILDLSGRRIAQGLTEYSSTEVRLLKGLKTEKIRGLLGAETPGEVVHRDNLVILV